MKLNLFIQLTVLYFAVTDCSDKKPWKKKCADHFELLFYKSPTRTYTQAKTFCEGLGGYLAKVDNKKMTYVINSTFKIEGGSNSFFIGGNDRENEGDWKWQDGTDVIMRGEKGYQNWKFNQPNNAGGNEDCLLVGRETYKWIDSSCDESLFYICQRDGRGRVSVKRTKINQTTSECVLTTCDTSATVGWYKNSGKISTDSGNTVYQELKSRSAILYLENAKISDSGTYSCQARISNQKKDEITMVYEVAGKPTIHKISNFPCKSNLEVHWKPHKNAVGFPHKIEAKPGSGELIETKWTDSPIFENQTTTLSSLTSSTEYNVEVTACVKKESCSTSKFKISKLFRTDGAVPTVKSASVAQNNENQSCAISWGTNEDDKTDQKTELTMNETLISKRDSKINEGKISKENVTSSEHHNFTPEPNRRYSVSIKIYNCAGASQPFEVSGNCQGKPEAPGSVPVPKNSDGDVISANGTHSITVQRPDETNGLVSCLFVMVAKAGAGGNAIFTLKDLQKANNSLNNSSSEYIAMALPVSSMQETQITVQLGDESVTSCDVNKTVQNNSGRRKRSTDNANLFIGRNGKLDKENAYSVSIVSSTPAEDTIYFKRSTGITLKKAEDKGGNTSGGTPVWIFAVIAVVVILIIVVIVVVVVKKRRANEDPKLNQQQLGQDNPVEPEPHVEPREINGGQRDPQLIQPQRPQYAEVLIDRDHGEYVNYIPQRNQPVTETTITTSDLEKVYNSMKMKRNQQFVEQFREILQEAARYGGTNTFASDEALKKKNRYKNILPFDDSRVPLSGTREGYINACFINGHKIKRKYIATQGPLPGTVNDFWQMIVEHKCCVIVMLAREIEAGKKKMREVLA